MSEVNLVNFTKRYREGLLSGDELRDMVLRGELTKQDRRKITKKAKKTEDEPTKELSKRQKLRLEVKEKKKLPKLTREDRKRKYQQHLEDERESEQAKFTICLGCKKRGHFVKDCPRQVMAIASDKTQKDSLEICFNCGLADHSLKNCPERRDPRGYLPFANCFICKGSGHISRDCPQNAHGLYPKGGCCHICQLTTHLARDCPKKPKMFNAEKAEGAEMRGLVAPKGSRVGDDIMLDDFKEDTSDLQNEEEEDEKKSRKKAKKRKL